MTNSGNRPIAFLDSGIGGIPYFLWVRTHLPQEPLIYLADHLNFPYGIKTPEEIQDLVIARAKELIELENPKIFVLACNSATVHALDKLRSSIDLPVVGVVPAIKPAARDSLSGHIGIWATRATVESEYMDDLIRQFAADRKVFRHAETHLVSLLEEHILDWESSQWESLLTPQIQLMGEQGVDRLVLGCTHFTYLDKVVERVSQGRIIPVDSREGVGRQIQRILDHQGLLSQEKNGSYGLYTTLETSGCFYQKLAERYNIEYRGVLT